MQKCNGSIRACPKNDTSTIVVAFSIPHNVLEVLDKKVSERKVKSRSVAVTEAVTCWIYREEDKCEECPYFEPEGEPKQ